MSNDKKWVKIEREIDAPVTRIWDMWTQPELFASWYGPRGMSITVLEMDVVVGGTRRICMEMSTPDREMKMWFTGVYKEVTAPNRLIYTESMCDESGTIIPPQAMGMPADFPEITQVIVDLVDLDGKTKMTMTHIGVEAGTAGAGGWGQACDKLAEAVASTEEAAKT